VIAPVAVGDGSAIASSDADRNADLLPQVTVRLDMPASVLRGRRERLGMSIASEPVITAFTLAAGIVSSDMMATPPGESGQAFRPGAAFARTLLARRGPEASATMVLRVRRHAADGSPVAERLLLARDLQLRVRTVAGFSAPVAAWVAGGLAFAGALAVLISRRLREG